MGSVETSGRAPRTIDSYRVASRRVLELIGPYPATQLAQGLLEDYAEDRIGRGGASSSTGLDATVVRMAWAWARRRGLIAAIDLPRISVREGRGVRPKRTPTAGDVAAVIAEIERRYRAPWLAPAIRLLWALGCRPGELAGLPWSRVDMEQGRVTLIGKTGPRRIPLPPEAVAELRALHPRTGPEGYVLGVRPGTVQKLGAHLKAACEAVGIDYWTPYGTRRAAVDRFARGRADVAAAAAFLGHSPEVAWRKYRQVTEADLADALARADLGALPRGEVHRFRRNSRPEQEGEEGG